MSKLITIEDGYEIRLGQKNPTCYPCCFEGSVCACRSDLCIKHRDNHGKTQEVMVWFTPVEMIVRL